MEERLMIRQGLVHDAVHREPYLADILVEGGKIRKIAPTLDAEMIDQTKLLDAKGLQVYPGFVEAHCHLGLDGYGIGFGRSAQCENRGNFCCAVGKENSLCVHRGLFCHHSAQQSGEFRAAQSFLVWLLCRLECVGCESAVLNAPYSGII